MKKLILTFTSFLAILLGVFVPSATAEEIIVSGNGSESVNTATTSTTQQVNVDQSNTANITNNITTNANTGDNEASDNVGGDTTITTGDITTNTEVTNTGNYSAVNVGACDCPAGSTTNITGNGPRSVNTVDNSISSDTNISVNQDADITNNITTNANTGRNRANDNVGGNVLVKTGNIYADIFLMNGPFNVSKVKAAQGQSLERLLKIAGNGRSSVNTINNVEINNVDVSVNNVADFLNRILANLNTGDNDANDNVGGDVAIKTGDVWAQIKVTNLANINEVIIDCGCKEKPGENPPIVPPGIPTTPSSTSSSSSPSQPSVQGVAAALGEILPATGGNWLLFAMLANIGLFFLGAYLRLRSGRSPGLVLAK